MWIESGVQNDDAQIDFDVQRTMNENWSVFTSPSTVDDEFEQNVIVKNSSNTDGMDTFHVEPIQYDTNAQDDYAYLNPRHDSAEDIMSILGGMETGFSQAETQWITYADVHNINVTMKFDDVDDESYSPKLHTSKLPDRQVECLPDLPVKGEDQSAHARNVNEIYGRSRVVCWGIQYDSQVGDNLSINYNEGDSSNTYVKKWPSVSAYDARNTHQYLQEWTGIPAINVSQGQLVGIFNFIPVLEPPASTRATDESIVDSSVTAEWNFRWELAEHVESVSDVDAFRSVATAQFDLKQDQGTPFTHYPQSTNGQFPFLFQQWVNRGGGTDPMPSYLQNKRPWRAGLLYPEDMELVQTVRAVIDIDDLHNNADMTTPFHFRVGVEWDPNDFGGYIDPSPWDSETDEGLDYFNAHVVMVGQTIYERGGSFD
jgi:hypothetical protein